MHTRFANETMRLNCDYSAWLTGKLDITASGWVIAGRNISLYATLRYRDVDGYLRYLRTCVPVEILPQRPELAYASRR